MDKNQKSKQKMSNSIDNVFDNYQEEVDKDQGLKDAVAEFDQLKDEINTNAENQLIDIRGKTEKKYMLEQSLIDFTIDLQGRIMSLAAKIKDPDLYNIANRTRTELNKFNDDVLYFHAQNLVKLAKEHKDELVPYGVDDKMIEEYGKEAQAYINYCQIPHDAIQLRKKATENLNRLFPQLMNFLTHVLDANMLRYYKTNPDFYKDYFNARMLVDGATHKLAAMGKIIDEETKLPLQYVTVTFTPKNGTGAVTVIRTAITTELGNYRIKTLEEGAYVVTFEQPYYDTITIELYYFKGQQLRLNEALRKTE